MCPSGSRQQNFSLALALGVWLYTQGAISVGSVFAGLSYAMLLRGPLMHITSRFQDIEAAAVSVRRLNELFDERGTARDGDRVLASGPKGITLEHVSFSYGDQPVLRDVSLILPPGETLGVIGRTGSGKSTLIRLLFRQYDPGARTVRIGGADLRDLTVASLRSRIALVTQEVHLLRASLRDNLTFFDPAVPDERLVRALTEVGLAPWYESLPAGLATPLGGDGVGLSAGQEQLVALARAFLTDPDVALLDEPSSRIDPYTERLLRQAIIRFTAGRTAVVVAHRMETLHAVDRILLLHDGRAVRYEQRAALFRTGHDELEQLARSGALAP